MFGDIFNDGQSVVFIGKFQQSCESNSISGKISPPI